MVRTSHPLRASKLKQSPGKGHGELATGSSATPACMEPEQSIVRKNADSAGKDPASGSHIHTRVVGNSRGQHARFCNSSQITGLDPVLKKKKDHKSQRIQTVTQQEHQLSTSQKLTSLDFRSGAHCSGIHNDHPQGGIHHKVQLKFVIKATQQSHFTRDK